MTATSGQGATPASPIDLTVDPLPQLQLRRSEKWTGHGPDVIASTIAEWISPWPPR